MGQFTGEVYDIDYISGNGWCQILMRNDDEPQNVVVVTDKHQIQTILETAMLMKLMAEVAFEDKEPHYITRAKVNNG